MMQYAEGERRNLGKLLPFDEGFFLRSNKIFQIHYICTIAHTLTNALTNVVIDQSEDAVAA